MFTINTYNKIGQNSGQWGHRQGLNTPIYLRFCDFRLEMRCKRFHH